MKTKKLFNKIVIAILGMMLLIGAGIAVNKVVKNSPNTKVIGSAIGEYTAVQNGDDAITNTNFVTFDAYFLNNGQKVRGAYLPFTKKEPYGYNVATTDLWMEIKVLSNGSLRNGKLLFTRDNVEETFALIEDDFVKSDVIGDNALSVSLKDIQTGTTKLLKIKITPNVNKFFSNDNKVKLVGDHVDNDGRITRIEKEVNFAIDTSVDNAVAMNKIYSDQYISRDYYNFRFKDKDNVIFSYYNQINFGSYQNSEENVSNLSLKEGVIEGEVTAIDGVYPSEILLDKVYSPINSDDFIVEYNKNNGKFKIRCINPRNFGNMFNIRIDTIYKKDSINFSVNHVFSIKTTAYAVVNNNEKLNNPLISNKAELLDNIRYTFIPRNNDFLHIGAPTKDIPIAKYEGDEFEKDLETWVIYLYPFVDNLNGSKEVILYQDVNNYDKLTTNLTNLQNAVDIDNYVTNTGVSIDYRGIVSDNARIELYDNDTGSLIHTFNKSEIEGSWNKVYNFDSNVNHLKYVIKNIDLYNEKNRLSIKSLKTINNKELIKNVNRSEFDKLNYISSGYTMEIDKNRIPLRKYAPYEESNRVKVSHFSLENPNPNYNMNSSVPKIGMIKAYNGIDTGDDLYKTIWTIKSESRHEENLQIISKDGEKFRNATNIVEGSYSKYHGIQFLESPRVLLGDNGWIKVYNNETGELITVFNNSNWNNYISNAYIYGNDIKSIKILTSKIVNRAYFHISHIMKIDDELFKENVTREEFDKIVQIKKELEYSSKLAVNSPEFTGKGEESINVEYYNVKSFAESNESVLLSSYKSMNVLLKFNLSTLSFYNNNNNFIDKSWKASTVLMEFPKDIVDVEIRNIKVANANVLGHEIIDKGGKKFLKINLDSDHFVKEQDIDITANITVNPLVDTKETEIKVYALNAANDLYVYKENNKFVDLNDKKDIYDIDGNNDKEEKVAYTEIKTKIIAPDDLYVNQKIVDYNTAGDVVNAPNIGVIDGNGTGKAKVVIQLKNNYSPSITDVRLAGAIPFEGNKGLLTGNDFNSKNTTIMMGPIKVPDDLKNDVKVYYSENLEISNTNKSWVDPANNWKLAEDVTDWSKIKHYYIDFGDKVININEIKEFSYEVQMPQNIAYNNPTYASVAFTANLNTNDGKLFTSGEANKVGLQLLKRFDLEIESNKLNSEYKIAGTSYLIRLDDDSDNRSVITNTNGKAKISGLLLDKEYTIEKKSIDENYLGDNSKVRFKVIESNGNRILQFIDGEDKLSSSEIIQPTSDTLTKVNFKFSYISKYNLTLNKVDAENNQPLMGISYSLYEGEQVVKTSGTGKNGTIIFKGLTPGLEYTIKEVRADGYYLNEPFKFKVVNTDGNPTIVKLSGNGENLVINKSNNGLDEASVKFTNLRAKKYSLDITKYVKGKEQKLSGAGFMVTGNDFVTGKVAETDENGHLVINGLYEYKPGQSYSGEYTIEEIAAPSGYTRSIGKLKIKAQRNNAGILEVSVIEDTLTRTINSGKDIVLEGADTETPVYKIGVEDSPLFTIIKTDAKTGDRLPKTKFAIYEVNDDGSEGVAYDSKGNIVGNDEEINGVRYRVIETDENGEYTKDLKPGKYKFIELSTVDKRYEISKDPILVNIGKQVQPKYGWTVIDRSDGLKEYYNNNPDARISINGRAWSVGADSEYVYYDKDAYIAKPDGIGYEHKIYWTSDKYRVLGVYSRYSWDDKVVLIRDLTEGNKRFVVLDVNNGKEIRSIPMENDSEQIVSAKIIYNGVTKKYKVYDDDYNVLFEFQREGDILYGVSSLKKVGNNYYIQILEDNRSGRDVSKSKLLKLDVNGNFIKEYDNSILNDDNIIMKVEHEEAELNGNPSFKFIIKFYDLEDNLIQETDPVNVEMWKPYFMVFKNGDIIPETNKYYKFGITVPGEEPVSEINVKNNWKKFNIKAKYSPNGSITDITASDVDWKILEELEINSNSNKEIKITPDAGFKITKVLVNEEEINLNINPDGSMDLPKFENITEDKFIRAEFGNNVGYVKVNHYKKDTNEKLAESETLVGNYRDNYTTSPAIIKGYELERNVAGDFVKPTNATGTFTTDDIEVNYYYQPKQVDVTTSYELENGTKIIPDSTQKVEYGKDYTTVPGVVDNKYELVTSPDNSNGKISSETPVTVRYIYKLKDSKVTVHHYIDGTTDKVPNNEGGVNEDQVINGRVDDAYNTAAITTIPANYKVVNTPVNAAGTMTVDPIEVTYFYKLKDATIENSNFEKTSPQVINNINQKFVYNIKYTGSVKDYIGKAVLEIVDTLPYKIDIDKSDLAGGEYDEEHKTIKWKILVNNINSFDNNGNVEIIKTFGVVYKDLPIGEHVNITNTANVKFSLKDVPEVVGVTNKEKEVETTTDGQFTRRITVNKTWVDDNNANGKRPVSIKYVLSGNNQTKEQIVTGNTNSDADWNYTFTNLPKYDAQGNEIVYTVDEQEVNAGDFKFYTKQVTGLNITNTFTVPNDKIELTVNKTWVDDSNANSKRPASIKYVLTGNNQTKEQVVTGNTNSDADWNYTFTNLPKYDAQGNEIVYTVDEQEVNAGDFKFYTKQVTGLNITNTFTVPNDKIELTVNKTWSDDNNVNGKRPVSIKYVLTGNGLTKEQVVTGNTSTNEDWSYKFTELPKYNSQGNEIVYTVDEQEVNPGDFKFYTKQVRGLNITNIFTVPNDKIELTVNKTWVDDNNANGKRPTSIKYVLTGNGLTKEQVVTGNTSTNEDWSYKFTDLPKYNAQGNEIVYTVDEQEVNGGDFKFYTKQVTGLNITNTFTVPADIIEVSVSKHWDDNSNANGKRPASIKYVLSGNGLTKEQVVTGNTNSDADWNYTFTNLPKYNSQGNEIVYTVDEQEVNPGDFKFYKKQVVGLNVTNIFTVPNDKIEVQVNKVWEDNLNVNSKRPTSIKYVLSGNGLTKEQVVTGNTSTNEDWSYKFTDLPKYNAQGNEIAYTVAEKEAATNGLKFYTNEISGEYKTALTIKNKFTVPEDKVEVEVTKHWEDNNNANHRRPTSIKYVLKGNGLTKEQEVIGNATTDAGWNYKFTNLPKYNAQGNEITYTVEEQEVNANDLKFYTKEVNGFNVTNTFKVPEDKVNVKATKTWVDSSNAKGKRPSSIKYILKGGKEEKTQVVSGNNTTDENWSYKFENLAKYDSNGQEYQYNVEEEITENAHLYTKVITGNKESGFNVINTFKVPEDKLTIAVTKEWKDNSNVASKRPTSIKYVLKGGATPIEEVVSGNNTTDADWNHTFTNVAKYNDSGDEITYTLEEQEVSANDFKFYKKAISGDYKAGFNVANTFEVPNEKVEVQVNKVWEDDSNANTKRPASIKYILKGGATPVEQVVSGNTTSNADWSYKFTNLPKYSATGDEIQYTVEEQEVNTDELKFYEKEITGSMNAGFNIKNKFKVPDEKVEAQITKTWEDNSNVNGKRPTSIKYVLSGNGSTKEQTVTGNTTTNDNWSYTFANLPKYNAQGNEITYTVEEQEVNTGDLKFYNKQIAGFNVTNTFRIPDDKVKVEITKKWEDSSNVSNKRPASVKIELSDGANVVRTQELTGTGNEWKHTFTDLPKYNSQGNTITYTLEEKEVNPGDLQFYTKSIVGNTITNTFTQSTDKINVNVSKTWDDSNNANRKRPVSIKYVLKNKETVVSEKVVAGNETTDADWTHTFTGLAKYDEHNDEIKYTLEEQEANEGELKFYTKQVNGDYKAGFNVVNTFKVPDERINVRVSKTWNDDSNSRSKRPTSIKYVLSGNGSTVEQIVTGESNTDTNWSYEFSNLVKYEANTGNEISYTVREEEVNPGDLKFYEPTISGDYKAGINVTNKFVVPNDKVTPRVTITWEDNNNNGNKRPSNVKIVVKDKEGKVVKEGNVTGNPTDEEWNKVFENVPKYDKNGDPIPYTVEEKPNSPDDFKFYKITVTGDIDKGYKVTNKFEVPDEKVTVKVKKVWEDSNNAASKRPTAIKVQLKNNAAIVREERVTGSGNEWKYTFENVSKYNGYGDVINYTVEEIEEQTEDLKFYEKKITGDKDSEYVITNKFKVPDEKIEINVNKTWEDNNNAANKRPTSIKYVLSGNNQTQEQVVSGNRTTDANWSYEFTNVKKYDNNANEIVYSAEEQEVNANDLKFYTKKVSGEQTNGFAVVNKFTVPTDKVTVKVSKTWDDEGNRANKRPASIKYEVLNSNNQIVASKVQSGNKNTADGWSHNFELDKYDALGNEEVYNVQEVEVNQNDFKFYRATVSGNYKSGFTVTNKFEVPNEEVTPKISVEWKDNSNQNNKRPTSVKIQVKDEEGRIVKESPVTGLITEESWKKIFENVPKYNKNGDPINYTITEEPNNPNDLEFYTTTTSGNITNGFKVVNTYAVPGTTISLKANKKWLDGNNAKNKRPESIKIEVRNNNEVVADKEVKGNRTTDANWEVEFKNLPKYNPTTGAENVYTVTETEVHQGELMYYTSAVNGHTITNTIKPVTEGKIEDSKVEKESTLAKITKADEIVPYTITYKGKIKEYMGDAVVKIVDELPFKLDLSKSNIMDGSYDDESKTITWTENLNNIDTHSNGDKEVEIKKEIKLVYKDLKISEENLKVTNKVRAEISLKELNKKITENNTKEIPAEISSKVTVKYVLKSNRSMKLKEDKVITGHVGDAYQTTIPNDIDQDAYEFVEVEGNENGKISQEEKVVTYLYKKKFGKVVVSYVEKSTGMKLQNDEVIKGNINEPYNAEGKEIEYYNLVSTEKSENAKPVITEDEQKITHYYAKKVFNIEIDKELKEATIDGEKRTFRNGKFTKLDIPVKKILNSEVKVRYSINVRNTGEIKGSTVVQENIPKYFTMNPSENPDWRIENGKIVSKEIELNPGESKELSITLKWTNSKDNFGTLVNKAGIEKTKNNAGFEETDTEEEKKGKKQQATLVLVPKTGLDINKLLQMTGVGITLTALVAAMGYTISRKVRE